MSEFLDHLDQLVSDLTMVEAIPVRREEEMLVLTDIDNHPLLYDWFDENSRYEFEMTMADRHRVEVEFDHRTNRWEDG